MANGLIMSLGEFQSLPQKQKLDCLYENQVKTLSIITSYKFHQRIQYLTIGICVLGIGFLFKLMVGQ